jgi:hypothetical protein
MIHIAHEEDLKRLSRRGFMSLFGTTVASVAVAPTQSFFFFGDVLKSPAVAVIPSLPFAEGVIFNPPWWSEGMGVILSPRALGL